MFSIKKKFFRRACNWKLIDIELQKKKKKMGKKKVLNYSYFRKEIMFYKIKNYIQSPLGKVYKWTISMLMTWVVVNFKKFSNAVLGLAAYHTIKRIGCFYLNTNHRWVIRSSNPIKIDHERLSWSTLEVDLRRRFSVKLCLATIHLSSFFFLSKILKL